MYTYTEENASLTAYVATLVGSLSASVDEALCKNRDKFKDLTPYIIQQTHDPLYNSSFLRKGYLNNKHNATIDCD